MPDEIRISSVVREPPRVSPYPHRSSRTSNKLKTYVSPIQTEGKKEWEDVRCVICMEPPHNAVFLHCASSVTGCRPYMCDTTAYQSNCYKQFCGNKETLKCPLCRGDVFETLKVSRARRFMNAKPRSCTIKDCEFSGTYSQLEIHSRRKHPDCIPPKPDLETRIRESLGILNYDRASGSYRPPAPMSLVFPDTTLGMIPSWLTDTDF